MLKHEKITEQIIGTFYNVYYELGFGFLESVYETCMTIALTESGLSVQRQVPIPIWFRGKKVGEYFADLLVEEKVIVELKAARLLDRAHEAQLLHYLKATDIEVGMLLNFGDRPQFKRLVFDNPRKKIRGNPCESVAHSDEVDG